MKLETNEVDGIFQVKFEGQTPYGPFRDALNYTAKEWKTITNSDVERAARLRVDKWVAYMAQCRNLKPPVASSQTAPLKVLVLFGAGASHGAHGISPSVPPLGSELFDRLRVEFPNTWAMLSPAVAEIFRANPEKGMEALDDERYVPGTELIWLINDLVVYLSRFLITSPRDNLYCQLVGAYKASLMSGDVLFATLNYECLIELALEIFGIEPTYFGDPPKGTIKILKVHGSCNFIPEGFLATPRNLTYDWSYSAGLNTSINIVKPSVVAQELAETSTPAAMSMYTEQKQNPICPLWLNELRKEFTNRCQAAEVILTVGVRPNSEDRHIWDSIAKSTAKVFLVADDNSSRAWIDKFGNGKTSHLGTCFLESFDRLRTVIDSALVSK